MLDKYRDQLKYAADSTMHNYISVSLSSHRDFMDEIEAHGFTRDAISKAVYKRLNTLARDILKWHDDVPLPDCFYHPAIGEIFFSLVYNGMIEKEIDFIYECEEENRGNA